MRCLSIAIKVFTYCSRGMESPPIFRSLRSAYFAVGMSSRISLRLSTSAGIRCGGHRDNGEAIDGL